VANGTLSWSADDGISGRELWKTDGTELGTVKVVDVFPGAASSGPTPLAAAVFGMLFTADNGLVGRELWRTDGTAATTALVKNVNLGAGSGIVSGMAAPVEWNDALYFAANDGVNGAQLWTSDGTEAGTVLLKDIRAGAAA
jgi:large repetitive protein